jgi:hypothetical protein
MKRVQKKPGEFRRNKKAFDSVLGHFRKCSGSGLGASKPIGDGGRTTPNPIKPSVVDFRADVMKAVKKRMPKDIPFIRFDITYVQYDSDDQIDQERFAQKMFGERRHIFEQWIGEEFIRRGIHPCTKYFTVKRTKGGE